MTEASSIVLTPSSHCPGVVDTPRNLPWRRPNRLPNEARRLTFRPDQKPGDRQSLPDSRYRWTKNGGHVNPVRGKTRIVVDRSAGQTAETPCGASHTKRSIAVRVRPPRNSWPRHSYYRNGGSALLPDGAWSGLCAERREPDPDAAGHLLPSRRSGVRIGR